VIKKIWAEFRKPSERNPDPHHRGATGIWHAALGAIPGLVLADYGLWPASATVICVVSFYLQKEIGDLRRGGAIADTIEDAVFVGAGAFFAYYYALIGLLAINFMALAVMWLQIKERDDGLE
jgi:hypothetical protein